ncbi:MAG: hypothetical protein ABEH65_05730 [Halobacteriales archaeon]
MSVPPPTIPTDQLAEGGWERIEETERTFLESPIVTVASRFLLYEDRALRRAIRESVGIDQLWRSFFASRLRLAGPITVGFGTIIDRLIRPQAMTRFVDDLEDRGFRSVRRRGSRRLQIDPCHEASAIEYDLVYPIDNSHFTDWDPTDSSQRQLRGTAWLVIWAVDRDVLLSGGTYPKKIAAIGAPDLEPPFEPTAFRTELFELIRAVSG